MTIVGDGFEQDTIVTIGGIRASIRFATPATERTKMLLETPAHPAGSVEIVVANPDGASVRAADGFTYVPASSFDPNYAWSAASRDGSDRTLAFTIENNKVISATCFGATGETVRLSLPAPIPVDNSEFSFESSDGSALSGRMVAPGEMIGTMNIAPCTFMSWRSYPQR
jgi:hypothetical protein